MNFCDMQWTVLVRGSSSLDPTLPLLPIFIMTQQWIVASYGKVKVVVCQQPTAPFPVDECYRVWGGQEEW